MSIKILNRRGCFSINAILDTNIVLEKTDYEGFEKIYIPLTVLEELDKHKNFGKTEELKFKARRANRILLGLSNTEAVITIPGTYELPNGMDISNPDDKIILYSEYIQKEIDKNAVLCTYDINMFLKAQALTLNVLMLEEKEKGEYKGYRRIKFDTDENLAYFYEHLDINDYDVLTNEYILIEDKDGNVIDKFKWNGERFVILNYKSFKSRAFGQIKPLDDIQQLLFDSLSNNEITTIFGKAGSGKTTIPLAYIMQNLENQKFKRCHIVYHYEPLKGAKTLGYEKGTHIDKLINSASLGNILSTKFGDLSTVLALINTGVINIIPTCNIRGVEFGADDVVFCTESQNLNAYTLKTIIQRCKSGCKIILEGDILEQSDIYSESGLFRLIEVFKGYNKFGCVKLKNNYRNEINDLADKL